MWFFTVRRLLYQAFVLPHVDYCSIVWNHCGVMLRDRVERIQKYALRIIHGKPPRASSEPLLRALGWTSALRKEGTKFWYAWSISVYLTRLVCFCAQSLDQTQLWTTSELEGRINCTYRGQKKNRVFPIHAPSLFKEHFSTTSYPKP